MFDLALLRDLLGPHAARFDVDALLECGSTSDVLAARAARGAPSGSVVVAERQLAGRGRRGRNWRSWTGAPEKSLTFSLLWRFSMQAGGTAGSGGNPNLAGLSLAVGVAVARALEALQVPGIALKWPNDILMTVGDTPGKLGGILVELSTTRQATEAIIGIGLNLDLPPKPAEGERDSAAFVLPPAALAAVAPEIERHVLLARLLIELLRVLETFSVNGFAVLRDEWQRRHAWQDRPVALLGEQGEILSEGRCLGVDTDGLLLLATDSGNERIVSGDISLRPVR